MTVEGDTGPGRRDRVVEAHRIARHGLRAAAAFTVASIAALAWPGGGTTWAALHLFLAGGVLCVISGTTQMLAITWSASEPTPRRVADTQLALVATGATLTVTARQADLPAATTAGAFLVVAGLALLGVALLRICRTAAVDRYRPAIDGYLTAVTVGVGGTALGGMYAGWAGTGPGTRDAHLIVNLYGLVGIVIAATLPYFVATQLRTRTSRHLTPGRVRVLVAGLAGATAVAAGGALTGTTAATRTGCAVYAAGVTSLLVFLPTVRRRQVDFAGPRLAGLAAGLAWWVGITVAWAFTANSADDDRLAAGLVVGGYAQIVAVSVAYLAPVLRGGGHVLLTDGFAVMKSWPAVAALNVAALGAVTGTRALLVGGIGVWVVDTTVRTLRFTSQTRHRTTPPEGAASAGQR